MLHLVASLLFIVVFNDVCLIIAWDPSNFTFNPGDNYELVWQDQFENVGPVKAIINGQPAYSPNPKNWGYITGMNVDGGLQNFTDSIYNSYVQNGQLTIVALKENLTSGMLTSKGLQEFTFGTFAAKIRLPYGQGMWPAYWLLGNAEKYGLWWPTCGEVDILEMIGGDDTNTNNQIAFGTVHWNNLSNKMNPWNNKALAYAWRTPDGTTLHNNSLVYWTEWNATTIRIGINEFVYSVVNTTNFPDSINPVWAFSGMWPFYMILNIGIGGPWPGPPDVRTVWPQQMIFDWVRVYQQKKTVTNE